MLTRLVKVFLGWLILTSICRGAEVKPLHIQADTMEAYQNKNMVLFKGHVKAEQDGLQIYGDLMRVFYTRSKKNSQKALGKSVDRVEAEGHVVIIREDKKATGKKAIFYREPEEKIVLSGDAQIEDQGNLISGEEVTILLKENRMIIKGRPVKATIRPKDFQQ